ncbi:putative phosphatase regulatory subunit-domain-containing protein [Aspergillus avenaceus]|uniref:Putative phosphatase regulatory subunit-domain-containing protein n=1 Tax=Aspergillus avenaceus TaxID=36643 RepID=A0A5N6TMR3_ASPAV|nr:putative phosphatase regulatory subunit-domain-containing protein [Aspergillus avenaceus]
MPYTAPLKPSPSAQHIENIESTSHSCPTSPTLAEPQSNRPRLSRTYSSTAYVRKHRRSPSTSKTFAPPAPSLSKHVLDSHAAIRQSPPPRSEAPIPPGAVISPPESAPNSSDEELSYKRRDGLRLEELEAAVRSIEQRRASLPERDTTEGKSSSSLTLATNRTPKLSHPPLSREARKISHSRSVTEHSISIRQEEAVTSSPEESDRDDEPRKKQPMVRKKSGELVRPALRPPSARRRPSSMPGTPTYSKAVHFDSQLEHIRHFLQLDKPQAVSAGASPVDDYESEGGFPFGKDEALPSFEWDIRLPNFPRTVTSRAHQRVRLERLFLSSDKSTLVGVVAVANIAFHKHVAARFTFDHWKTVSEVIAEYSDDVRRKQIHDGYDRFCFSIKLNEQANLEKKTMFLCMRYNVCGQEYWDNNDSKNYQVTFIKVPKVRTESSNSPAKPSTGPRVSLPRSRTFAGSTPSQQAKTSSLNDFTTMNNSPTFGHPSGKPMDGPVYGGKTHDDVVNVAPSRREKQAAQVFGSRYDFEASLNAAMKTKQTHDRTTLTARAKSEVLTAKDEKYRPVKGTGSIVDQPLTDRRPPPIKPEHPRPSSLVSSKPHRESSVYKELVDRYCFFGSSHHSSNRPESGPERSPPNSVSSASSQSSPTLSPKIDVSSGGGSRNSSPTPLGYSYMEPIQNSFLKESQRPAVIRG